MPVAAIRATYDSSAGVYAPDTPLIEFPDLLARTNEETIVQRLAELADIANKHSPSPLLNALPFLTPWLIIAPMLVMVSKDSLDYPWIWVIMFAMVVFFCSVVIGPLYVNRRLTKRYMLIKAELEHYTKVDCFETYSYLAWRFSTLDLIDFNSDPYDITIEILILMQEDLSRITTNGLVLLDPTNELFQQDQAFAEIYDPEIVVDPPPAYLDKPPDYVENVPLDGDYELHTFTCGTGYENVTLMAPGQEYLALSAEHHGQDLSLTDEENLDDDDDDGVGSSSMSRRIPVEDPDEITRLQFSSDTEDR
ncbi:hypothetical protein RI367_008083 [Sorochytrium milnesiophthora]